jgi:RNA polymerase sigma factor (sigma-70 family)
MIWREISLDMETSSRDGDASGTILDRTPDRSTPRSDDLVALRQRAEYARRLLGSLKPSERRVLERRYGFDEAETRSERIAPNVDATLQEIGDEWGVTRERVRQIEAGALQRLRKNSSLPVP